MISLEGVRILAISQYGAGPWGSMHLADLGAEVIKIEDPTVGGDVSRTIPPYAEGNDSLFFQTFNRNKLGITLNLASDDGQHVFRRLVQNADAVYSNLRGDLPDRMKLTYEDLKDVNPQIVCCHLTGFGRDGERASEPAYDYLIQAESGMMSLTGHPEGPPERCGLSIIDFVGGVTAGLALTAGILSAKLTGRGSDVDVSLLDVGNSLLNYLATWHMNQGYEPQRMADSAHPTLVPSQSFPTKDGYIVIMCNKEKFWTELCNVLEAEDLSSDPRFQDFSGRAEHREELVARLKQILAERSTDEWLALMRGRVPASPVNTVANVLKTLIATESPLILSVDHPVWGEVKELATPIRAGRENRGHRRAPGFGEHTREVLAKYAGVTSDEFERLQDVGAV